MTYESLSCLSKGYNPLPFPKGWVILSERRTHLALSYLPQGLQKFSQMADANAMVAPHHKDSKIQQRGLSGGCPSRPRESSSRTLTETMWRVREAKSRPATPGWPVTDPAFRRYLLILLLNSLQLALPQPTCCSVSRGNGSDSKHAGNRAGE